MSRAGRDGKNLADLDELIAEITLDAYGDDEKLWAFRQAFDLTDSDDEDIVDAVFEATAMAEGPSDEDDEDDELRPERGRHRRPDQAPLSLSPSPRRPRLRQQNEVWRLQPGFDLGNGLAQGRVRPGGEVAGFAVGAREWHSEPMRALLETMLPGASRAHK